MRDVFFMYIECKFRKYSRVKLTSVSNRLDHQRFFGLKRCICFSLVSTKGGSFPFYPRSETHVERTDDVTSNKIHTQSERRA
jgi:hypothetical protein